MKTTEVELFTLTSGMTLDDILEIFSNALGPEPNVPSAIVARFQVGKRFFDLWAISSRTRLDLRLQSTNATLGQCLYDPEYVVKDVGPKRVAEELRKLARKVS